MVNPASTTRVVCLGDPVLDILANVTYKFLEEIDASAGGCIAVSPDDMAALLDRAGAIGQLTRWVATVVWSCAVLMTECSIAT